MKIDYSKQTLLLASMLVLGGCMNYPRNGQAHEHARDPLQFTGAVSYSRDVLRFEALNQVTGDTLPAGDAVYSGTSPLADEKGTNWYLFNQPNGRLPFGANLRTYWRLSTDGGQRRMHAKVRTLSQRGNGPLRSFDLARCGLSPRARLSASSRRAPPSGSVQNQRGLAPSRTRSALTNPLEIRTREKIHTVLDADDCMSANQSSGAAIAVNCASSQSPWAEINVNCGKAGQDCCYAHGVSDVDLCDVGGACDRLTKRCDIVTGGLNQPCNSDNSCGPGLICEYDTCRDLSSERAAILNMEVYVLTCGDSDWLAPHVNGDPVDDGQQISILMKNSDYVPPDSESIEEEYWLDRPGRQFLPGRWDSFGMIPVQPSTLGDFGSIELKVWGNDHWCLDRIVIMANGRWIYDKSYPGSEYMGGGVGWDGPSRLLISEDELRRQRLERNSIAWCDAPSAISGSIIQAHLETAVGDMLIDASEENSDFDADWGSNGYITATPNALDPEGTLDLNLQARGIARKYGGLDPHVTSTGQAKLESGQGVGLLPGPIKASFDLSQPKVWGLFPIDLDEELSKRFEFGLCLIGNELPIEVLPTTPPGLILDPSQQGGEGLLCSVGTLF